MANPQNPQVVSGSLPQQIPPQTLPLVSEQNGQYIMDQTWYLYLYQISRHVLPLGGNPAILQPIPGPPGPTGPAGAAGAMGPPAFDPDPPDEVYQIPGIASSFPGSFGIVGNGHTIYLLNPSNGVAGNGSTDDTAAIQAAINSLGSAGGVILMGQGSFLISSVTIPCPLLLIGYGANGEGSQIIAKDATSNVLKITNDSVYLRDIIFSASVTRTAGAYVYLDTTSSIITVENCYMSGWYWGVYVNSGGTVYLRNLVMRNGVPGAGQAVRIDGGSDLYLDALFVDNPAGSQPDSGVCVTNCGDLTLMGCQLQHCNFPLSIVPSAGQVATSVYAVRSFFDNAGNIGVRMVPLSNTGTIQRVQLVGCWASSAVNNGVQIDNSAHGGGINGVEIIGIEAYANGGSGLTVNVSGTGSGQIDVLGGKFAQNGNDGIQSFACPSLKVVGARCGPVGAFTGNAGYGFQNTGAAANMMVLDCDLTGNTGGAFADSGSGSGKMVANNNGWNNSASRTSAITVTASPFTYTAGSSQETVYIFGGTVSNVQVDGANTFATTNVSVSLGPGKSVVVTYTVAPSMDATKL